MYPMEKYLHYTFIVECFLNGLGAWIKYYSHRNIVGAFIGNFVVTLAQLLTTQGAVFVVDRWFASN
jgi:hypothetical protein